MNLAIVLCDNVILRSPVLCIFLTEMYTSTSGDFGHEWVLV